MTSLAETIRRDVRLTILRTLAEASGYRVNHRILRTCIDRLAGISLTGGEVKEHLAWLEDAGAVTTRTMRGFVLAQLTDLGLALARGEETLEGVSRPAPSEM